MEKFNSISKIIKRLVFTAVVLSMNITILNAGGPWPQPKGKAYAKLSEWWIVFNQHYTNTGKTDPNVTTGVYNTVLYVEYGLTDRITAIVNAPIFSRNLMNNLVSRTTNEILVEGEAINSIGDIELGGKYGLTKPGARVPVALSLILGLPTGVSSGGTLNNLQTGDGEFNQMIRLDAGRSIPLGPKADSYVSGYVGFNHRTEGFSEEFRFGLEYGLGLWNRRFWMVGKLNASESLQNGDTAETATSTSIFANNAEFLSLEMEVSYRFTKHWGLAVSYANAVRGSIIAASPSYSVGVFYDMSGI